MARKRKKTKKTHSDLQVSQVDDDHDKNHNEKDIEIETMNTDKVKESSLENIMLF